MDVLSILGLLIACIAIVGGLLLGGGALETLFNGQALLSWRDLWCCDDTVSCVGIFTLFENDVLGFFPT